MKFQRWVVKICVLEKSAKEEGLLRIRVPPRKRNRITLGRDPSPYPESEYGLLACQHHNFQQDCTVLQTE